MIWAAARKMLAYFTFVSDPCDPSVPDDACQDCYAETLGIPQGACRASTKPCGHHCPCSWTTGVCCWCAP